MFFKHNSLMYIIGVSLSVAYSPSIASSEFNGFRDTYPVDVMKVEKRQQRNPWAMKSPTKRDANQYFLPRLPEGGRDKYITDEELDALNHQSNFLHGWKPLPSLQGLKQQPYYESPSYLRPSGKRMRNGNETRVNSINKQWDVPPVELSVDPMDPGRSGAPFDGPFRGIDSFMYE